jgi:hypothetical protein
MKTFEVLTILLIIAVSQVQSQGLVIKSKQNQEATTDYTVGCGSNDFMKHLDSKISGYYDFANKSMTEIVKNASNENYSKSVDSIFVIPVVFHIVYNNGFENIPDSVIQIRLLC